jgi:DNA-binding NtrC family response regulator
LKLGHYAILLFFRTQHQRITEPPEETVSAWRVLVVGDTENGTISDTLLDWGIHVIRCRRVSEASKILGEQAVAQIFCDAKLPDGNYRDVVAMARSVQPKTRVVVLMPNGSAEHSFQEAILAGAFDSIPSPAGRPDVQWEVLQAMRESSQGRVV